MHTLINKAIGKKERWERGGCRKGRKFYFWLFNVLWLLFKEKFLKFLLCILILMNLHKVIFFCYKKIRYKVVIK